MQDLFESLSLGENNEDYQHNEQKHTEVLKHDLVYN